MFEVKDTIPQNEVDRGLRDLVVDGLTAQTMIVLTSGVFLIAFGVKLGASNLMIGLLASIPPLSQLIQIPSTLLVERVRKRKKISVISAAAGRFFLLVIAAIPFFFDKKAGLLLLFTGLILHTSFSAVSTCSWNSWMRDFVPSDRVSTVFSKRLAWGTGVGMVLFILCSVFIDYWERSHPEKALYSFSILFALGFLAGMTGLVFLSRVPEPKMISDTESMNLFAMLTRPLKHKNFRNLILFLGSWSFAVNIAAPFFAVYMLRRLGYSMHFIILLTVLSQLMSAVSLRYWARLTDRFSNKTVLKISAFTFYICILGWTFTTMPDKYSGTLPIIIIIHIFMGFSIAGVALAAGNVALKLAPQKEATGYLATNIIINSIVAGIAPVLGGKFADFFEERKLSWTLKWLGPKMAFSIKTLDFQGWDFFFFFAFIIGMYSLRRLKYIEETGEINEKIVFHEFLSGVRRNMRNLSTLGGIRQLVQLPMNAFWQERKKVNGNHAKEEPPENKPAE